MNASPQSNAFALRRAELARRMGGGIAIIPTAPEKIRSRDSDYLYRFDSYFYYLTGFAEPEAVLALIAGDASHPSPRSILFCRDKHPERELWEGARQGPEAARERYGFDEAYSISQLDETALRLLGNQTRLFFAPGTDRTWDGRIIGWLNQVREQVRSGISAPAEIHDVRGPLDEMRLRKDEQELRVMRRAAEISAQGHIAAMRATRPGRMEYEIEAELLYAFRRRGAQYPAYWPIVAGGANACVLHYRDNNQRLNDGDLLLVDAGCELDGYASDVTRTWPINGRFSSPQRDLYELVLAAQAAAIEATRAGATWNAPHEAAVRRLAEGFVHYGLCEGPVERVLETEDYKRFYMHRTGHWLGLDVHDAGEYKLAGTWRTLEPGMVLTVEPGCYVKPGEKVPEAYWNIGIRIEDDVLVTCSACEVITLATPKSASEIEALIGHD